MNWQKAMEAERVMMQCLVALFLSLAATCDRASTDTHARRAWMLFVLRPASTSALRLASHHAAWFTMWIDLAPAVPDGDSPEDAAELARYFRVLAQVLLDLLALLPQAQRCMFDPPLRRGGGGPCEAWWRGLATLLIRNRGPPLRPISRNV